MFLFFFFFRWCLQKKTLWEGVPTENWGWNNCTSWIRTKINIFTSANVHSSWLIPYHMWGNWDVMRSLPSGFKSDFYKLKFPHESNKWINAQGRKRFFFFPNMYLLTITRSDYESTSLLSFCPNYFNIVTFVIHFAKLMKFNSIQSLSRYCIFPCTNSYLCYFLKKFPCSTCV